MRKKPTACDVAELAGVSQTTVSFVLNERPGSAIPEHTRKRVLDAVEKLGYNPNHIARALKTGLTHTISLWVLEVYPAYYSYTLKNVRQQVSKDDYDLLIRETLHADSASFAISGLQWPVDGVIAFDCRPHVDAFLRANNGSRPPIVTMGVGYHESTDFVGIDLHSAVTEAVGHLVEMGHRRIAYLIPSGEAPDEARWAGYRSVIRQAGLQEEIIEVPAVEAMLERSASREHIKEYVSRHGLPEAIFCYDDEGAIGVYRGLLDIGVRIPDDVAIVGCDGIEDTEYLDAPLSTIATPIEEMCATAWSYLLHRLNNNSTPLQQTMLQPKLVIRESSARKRVRRNPGSD